MKIIEGEHYRAIDIGEDLMWDMGIPPTYYPTNQLVKVIGLNTTASGEKWCRIKCQDGRGWQVKQEYLAYNCIWEGV